MRPEDDPNSEREFQGKIKGLLRTDAPIGTSRALRVKGTTSRNGCPRLTRVQLVSVQVANKAFNAKENT
jgi:hypothetical protein